jgi:TatD DNase family protein
MWYDTHCHLTHKRLRDDIPAVLTAMDAAQVSGALLIGTGLEDANAGLKVRAMAPERFKSAAALDPFTCHELGDGFADALAQLRAWLPQHDAVALGEFGLDYYYDLQPKSVQAQQAHAQLALAEELNLPVVIHVRDAHDDMLAVLAEHPRVRGVIHSFSAGPAYAERYCAQGWYLGFGGMATFKNAAEIMAAAVACPLDRLVLETDAPFLAPVPMRGKRNEPAFVAHTGQAIGLARGLTQEEFSAAVLENTQQLFGVS